MKRCTKGRRAGRLRNPDWKIREPRAKGAK